MSFYRQKSSQSQRSACSNRAAQAAEQDGFRRGRGGSWRVRPDKGLGHDWFRQGPRWARRDEEQRCVFCRPPLSSFSFFSACLFLPSAFLPMSKCQTSTRQPPHAVTVMWAVRCGPLLITIVIMTAQLLGIGAFCPFLLIFCLLSVMS